VEADVQHGTSAARTIGAMVSSSDPRLTADIDALRACPLFDGVDDGTLGLIAGLLRVRRFRRAETIFHAGDPGDALFIVVTGEVKIILPSEDGSDPAILTTIPAGGFFGALALLDGAPRSATAVALDAVTCHVLHRDAFARLLDEQSSLRQALMRTLAHEIRRLTAQLEDLHFLDLPGRLARHLLRALPEDAGEPLAAGPVRLPWPYTQSELAGMIGGSRQTVNRLLADFVAAGLLRFEGDELVIPDPARLEAAAHR
jgi:CRP/FNR family cyclic AMP-dependent transcriptional regulator